MQLHSSCVDDTVLIGIRGDVVWADARVLDIEIERNLAGGSRKVVLYFESVRTMTSSTIGVLAGHARRTDLGSQLFLVSADSYVQNLLEESGLTRIMGGRIYRDMRELCDATGVLVAPECCKPHAMYDTFASY